MTAEGIAWAFTSTHASNWHPLTWLSHMLDCQLYGSHAGGHHLTNVALHALTAVVLFLVLWRMTFNLWPSAFVAAVFAIHPLRVESVAWVAERKDVLSGLFFMLTLWAYLGYVRHAFSLGRYLSVIILFGLGLMSKPMLVTLPFVLLLLDYWPLGRISRRGETASCNGGADIPVCQSSRDLPGRQECLPHLIVEKLPLLLLAAASCACDNVGPAELRGAVDRTVAAVAMWRRAGRVCGLSGPVLLSAGLGRVLSASRRRPADLGCSRRVVAVGRHFPGRHRARRRNPYLFVGWFWYLGMLVPVIGLVQVGLQAMADRYTYLPQIGLAIALTWGVAAVGQVFLSAGRTRAQWGRHSCLPERMRAVAVGHGASLRHRCWRDSRHVRGGRPRSGRTLRRCGLTRCVALHGTTWPISISPPN